MIQVGSLNADPLHELWFNNATQNYDTVEVVAAEKESAIYNLLIAHNLRLFMQFPLTAIRTLNERVTALTSQTQPLIKNKAENLLEEIGARIALETFLRKFDNNANHLIKWCEENSIESLIAVTPIITTIEPLFLNTNQVSLYLNYFLTIPKIEQREMCLALKRYVDDFSNSDLKEILTKISKNSLGINSSSQALLHSLQLIIIQGKNISSLTDIFRYFIYYNKTLISETCIKNACLVLIDSKSTLNRIAIAIDKLKVRAKITGCFSVLIPMNKSNREKAASRFEELADIKNFNYNTLSSLIELLSRVTDEEFTQLKKTLTDLLSSAKTRLPAKLALPIYQAIKEGQTSIPQMVKMLIQDLPGSNYKTSLECALFLGENKSRHLIGQPQITNNIKQIFRSIAQRKISLVHLIYFPLDQWLNITYALTKIFTLFNKGSIPDEALDGAFNAFRNFPPEELPLLCTTISDHIAKEFPNKAEFYLRIDILKHLSIVPASERLEVVTLFKKVRSEQETIGSKPSNLDPFPFFSSIIATPHSEREDACDEITEVLPAHLINEFLNFFPASSFLDMELPSDHDDSDVDFTFEDYLRMIFAVSEETKQASQRFIMKVLNQPISTVQQYIDKYFDLWQEIFGENSLLVDEADNVKAAGDNNTDSNPYDVYQKLLKERGVTFNSALVPQKVLGQDLMLNISHLRKIYREKSRETITPRQVKEWIDSAPLLSLESINANILALQALLATLPLTDSKPITDRLTPTLLLAMPLLTNIFNLDEVSLEPVEPITIQLLTLFKNLHLYKDILEKPEEVLTERQTHLIYLLESIARCSTGQAQNVNMLFSEVTAKENAHILTAVEGGLAKKGKDFAWTSYLNYIETLLSPQSSFMTKTSQKSSPTIASQLPHHAAYVKNMLAHHIGFFTWPKVTFDLHSEILFETHLNQSSEGLLSKFLDEFSINNFLTYLIGKVDLTQNPSLYAALNEAILGAIQPAEELGKIWQLNEDEDEDEEDAIYTLTSYGALKLIKALGIVIGREEIETSSPEKKPKEE